MEELLQEAVVGVEGRGGGLADGPEHAGTALAEAVQLDQVGQGAVEAPAGQVLVVVVAATAVLDAGLGEVGRVDRQGVDHLGEGPDDDALAVQLERRAQAEDQLWTAEGGSLGRR